MRRASLCCQYGISEAELDRVVLYSEGRCDCCNAVLEENCAVDHDHTTGRIRGLLCRWCNQFAVPTVEMGLVPRVVSYLERHLRLAA